MMKDSRGCLPPSLRPSHGSIYAVTWDGSTGLAGVESRRGETSHFNWKHATQSRKPRDVGKKEVAVSSLLFNAGRVPLRR